MRPSQRGRRAAGRRSRGLRLLAAALRLFQRPRLARMRDAGEMRRGLERAGRLLRPRGGAVRFTRADPPPGAKRPSLLWCAPTAGDADPDDVILFFHGGAYVAGSSDSHRGLAAALATASGRRIASVDYRLAPEHPFPAAVDDALAAYDAVVASGARAVAAAGDSAGGGLAFALAAALDAAPRNGPPLAAVAAFSPFLDMTLSGASLRINARREAMLPVERCAEVVDLYLNGGDPRDPRASPLLHSFRRPPPALLQVGSTEALLDDSRSMAAALTAAGGDVRLEIWPGAPHGWHFFTPHVPEARAAVASAGAFLAERLSAAAEAAETVEVAARGAPPAVAPGG